MSLARKWLETTPESGEVCVVSDHFPVVSVSTGARRGSDLSSVERSERCWEDRRSQFGRTAAASSARVKALLCRLEYLAHAV
jgi:hypothetical protein